MEPTRLSKENPPCRSFARTSSVRLPSLSVSCSRPGSPLARRRPGTRSTDQLEDSQGLGMLIFLAALALAVAIRRLVGERPRVNARFRWVALPVLAALFQIL